MVICLERGADLHMAQLMPLPLTVSCSSKIQIGFTFLVPAYPGYPGKEAVKWLLLLLLAALTILCVLAPNGARPVCWLVPALALRARPWPAAMPRLARQACEFSVVDDMSN